MNSAYLKLKDELKYKIILYDYTIQYDCLNFCVSPALDILTSLKDIIHIVMLLLLDYLIFIIEQFHTRLQAFRFFRVLIHFKMIILDIWLQKCKENFPILYYHIFFYVWLRFF